MGNRNSSNARSRVHGQATRASSSTEYDIPKMGKPVETPRTNFKGQHRIGVYSEQQQKTPLDNDDTFTNFIEHAKYKIRTVSHIGREQSNVAPAPDDNEAKRSNKKENNQNDQFSSFIQNTKNKLRATSSIRKSGSFKSG
ncbi:hypothetical protein RJT34_20173 [Clitoria ternatea]|uniref:Uncharacterized protein n=1 Tax=Clitoria ternatea TaxID=43366 RepID=A0AAN9ISX1_CLITE